MQTARPRTTSIDPRRWPQGEKRWRKRRVAPLLYCVRCSVTRSEPGSHCAGCGKPVFMLHADFAPWLDPH